ncbi:DNA translocase FtsK [Peribacillus alkalitolerans]|uniref:DNA translocase FtsK n=1 Tax=Peribacillus alkalitolerans TaxID=1550385 RepID=UPI0023DDC8E9|nr:DNA translocase FtsK [Peribacillus alkalitolerans]
MKWLKKIKKWFQDEEIIEIEEILTLEPKEHEQLKRDPIAFLKKKQAESEELQEKPTVKNKELEANVQYQYPKGNFRFPIIPDKDEARKKPLGRRHATSEKRENQSVQQQPIKSKEPRRSPKTNEVPIRNVNRTEKIVKTSTKPFAVTEIPSPVFGFKQRPEPKKSEPSIPKATVEFELDSSLKATYSTKEVLSRPTIYRQKEKVISQESKEDIQEVQVEKVDTIVNVNSVSPAIFRHQEKIITTEPTVAVQPLVVHSTELETIVDEDQSVPVIYKNQASIPFKEVELEKKEVQVEEPESYIQDKIVPPDIHEDGNESNDLNLEYEDELADNSGLTTHTATDLEEEYPEELPVRPKKHIPFNVVMLKQDKQKLMQNDLAFFQSSSRKMETSSTENTPLNTRDHAPTNNKSSMNQDEESNKSLDTLPIHEMETRDEELPYYQFPSLELLEPMIQTEKADDDWLEQQAYMLNETLKNFNVRANVVNVTQGPSVTRFEVQPEAGVKVNKITNLSDDIKLSLAAQDIRMEAPIPGKHTIGIEIPNRKSKPVFLREILESPAFLNNPSPLTAALGLDISGDPIVTDLRKMPHGLIAGATGSGKSVCINTMLVSLLYKATPQELKLLLIDPKMVELAPYNSIPHLVSPVITDVKAATAALKWAVEEMERRYELFAHTGVRDINRFNEKATAAGRFSDKLPFIVIIIDELADLMMMSPADVEEAICRIAQKARACGIHLIVATQRPSVDVITGLIKANIPTRIAFSVSSQVDSRTIIDISGAEKLLGKGDMLFLENGSSKLVRLQGTFVSDDEIDQVVSHVKREQEPQYLFQQDELLAKAQISSDADELFIEACEFVVTQNAASTSSLQRHFRIGYNRAARLMEMLESQGVISEARGSRPRDVLMGEEEIELFLSDKPM